MSHWEALFGDAFMPHGQCLYWSPLVLWLHVVSDGLTALAYFSIPAFLFTFARRRPDFGFGRLFVLFGAFILACGTTHVMSIITMWKGVYGLSGMVKAATALVSAGTAVVLIPVMPRALSLPSPRRLREANRRLEEEIRERERAEEETRRAKEELEDRVGQRTAELARSKAEMERFAFVASHDLQEPLRILTAYAGLLEEDCGGQLDDAGREYLGLMVGSADRMQRLIQDLLTYSRLGREPTAAASVNPGEALDIALENLKVATSESRARITRDDMPLVRGDGRSLVQLFQNLLGNAIKYAGDAPPVIHVGARTEGELVVVSVRDEGRGIAPEHHELIFEPFRRLHADDSEGTGIGLAICKRIVEGCGGRIWVESSPGRGSTFSFTLQRVES